MSAWLLVSIATDRVGNAAALYLAEGEISWPYIKIYTYMLYSRRRWIRGQICGRKRGGRKKNVSRLQNQMKYIEWMIFTLKLGHAIQFARNEEVENGKKDAFETSARPFILRGGDGGKCWDRKAYGWMPVTKGGRGSDVTLCKCMT